MQSAQLATYLQALPGFEIATPLQGSYGHMGATLTDAVLQAGVNYAHVVQPRVEKVRLHYPEATTTSAFLLLLGQETPARLLNWKGQRKLDTLLTLTTLLVAQQVETESDLRAWLVSEANRATLLALKGIGAKTIDYLALLVGEQTVAVDTHIFKLLLAANLPAQTYQQAYRLVAATADYMGVPRASLDFSIWRYMSTLGKSMTSKRPRITVVGSFAVGMTIRAPHFPVKGETLLGSDFDMGPGGKGSNQAVGAARLGAESHFVSMIGEDLFGEMAVKLYAQEGVHTSHLSRTTERNTGVGFITLNAAGDNHIVLDMGANELLSEADVDAAESLIAQSDVVLAVLEIPTQAAGRAMELARHHNVTAVLNPAPACALAPTLLANVDVLTPNESELRILLGLPPDDPTDTLELAGRLRQFGVRNIVVTRGADGALIIHSDGTTEQIPGVQVDVVDTTGAGDAFTCALAVALAEGKSLVNAVRFATVAGALACTKLGVIPALANRQAIEALIANLG